MEDGAFDVCVCVCVFSSEDARCIIEVSVIMARGRAKKTASCDETRSFAMQMKRNTALRGAFFHIFLLKASSERKKQLIKPKSNPNIHRCTDSFSQRSHTLSSVCEAWPCPPRRWKKEKWKKKQNKQKEKTNWKKNPNQKKQTNNKLKTALLS